MNQKSAVLGFSLKVLALLFATPNLPAANLCDPLWIEPANPPMDEERVMALNAESFTLQTYQMPIRREPLSQIVVLGPSSQASPRAEEALKELLTRHPVVVAAFEANQAELEFAKSQWAEKELPSTKREREYFAYFDRGGRPDKSPIAYALTRKVRRFKDFGNAIQKLHAVGSIRIGPIFFKEPWATQLTPSKAMIPLVVGGIVSSGFIFLPASPEIIASYSVAGMGVVAFATALSWCRALGRTQTEKIEKIVDLILDLRSNAKDQRNQTPSALLVLTDDRNLPKAIIRALDKRVMK